ncbi:MULTISPECIES: DUF2911 domain-containing protein [Myroides]|jgi:hypothetical protein|uniref:DUF2911 domain-containing protein n=2 Tax=Myroides odoratus TaxID=256 RepID=A0A9Q7E848_MYROD|nr:DUF2911 domain-containing protein [Myroides odoratus]MDH6599403.1 hypothetical protein [Myroides gitamensis]EHQ41874.1 hypothetical protein Myrod_1040 [Myroides odoratus DSM 2801]EKB09120.1 hypothetical protein HMPREF9716_00404 [Myroides odoratus CIP 103059]MCS4239592.1 hypothetical protein [Myroides odoratus]QQT99267.1 DUF2911 domain-containing protein [Myroides odoratus]
MIKKFVITSLAVFALSVAQAQVQTPPTSTKSEVHQVVGLTDVKIDYSRPNMRGRLVFGDLVPYGRLWRTGANMNTVVSFANDVEIDGKVLKKGSYAIYTIPKVEEWEVIFYKDTNNWGLPEKWDESKIALSTKVKVQNLDRKFETFTMAINNVNIDYADLEIMWERSLVPVRFKVPTDNLAMESITETFEGPKIVDYYAAAEYFYLTGKDLSKALSWINNAIDKSGEKVPYYFVRLKSQIQAKAGDKIGAVATAKVALDLAEKANNLDYVKMNKDAIKEWSKAI